MGEVREVVGAWWCKVPCPHCSPGRWGELAGLRAVWPSPPEVLSLIGKKGKGPTMAADTFRSIQISPQPQPVPPFPASPSSEQWHHPPSCSDQTLKTSVLINTFTHSIRHIGQPYLPKRSPSDHLLVPTAARLVQVTSSDLTHYYGCPIGVPTGHLPQSSRGGGRGRGVVVRFLTTGI